MSAWPGHRALGHDERLDEMQEVVRAAGLGAGAREPVAAEGLAADHGAGDRAVDVQVADRRAGDDVLDGVLAAAEQAAGQRVGERVDALAGVVDRQRRARPSAAARRPRRAGRRARGSTSATTIGGQYQPRLGAPAPSAGRRPVPKPPRAARSGPRAPGRGGRSPARRRCRTPRAARPERVDGGRDTLDEFVGDGLVHQQPRRRRALLTGVGEGGVDDRGATARSRSASASTMMQFLPPMSTMARLSWRWPGTTSPVAARMSSPARRWSR